MLSLVLDEPQVLWWNAWSLPRAESVVGEPVSIQLPKSLIKWLAIGMVLGFWWAFMAPTQIGGQTGFAYVSGTSMLPTLHTGDLVITRAQAHYEVGQVVTFNTEKGPVIHRLVGGSEATGWQTKGDNNNFVDYWTVPNSAIVGQYSTEVSNLGLFFDWINQNPGNWALLAFGLLLLPSVLPQNGRLRATLHRAAEVIHHDFFEGSRIERIAHAAPFAYALFGTWAIATVLTLTNWSPDLWLAAGICMAIAGAVRLLRPNWLQLRGAALSLLVRFLGNRGTLRSSAL